MQLVLEVVGISFEINEYKTTTKNIVDFLSKNHNFIRAFDKKLLISFHLVSFFVLLFLLIKTNTYIECFSVFLYS